MKLHRNMKFALLAITVASGTILAAMVPQNINEVSAKSVNTINSEDIRFLKTFDSDAISVKRRALQEHQEAINLIEKYAIEKNIPVDLDNPTFQEYAKTFAVAFGEFSAENEKKLIEFAKFIDIYENYAQNAKIKQYKEKIDKGEVLTDQEVGELRSIVPVENSPSTLDTVINENDQVYISTLFANGYDNIKARDYAYLWVSNTSTLRNNNEFGYYSAKNNCVSCWNDCTNFVSQALYKGGMNFQYGFNYTANESWNYSNLTPGYPWGGAQNFYLHWRGRAGVATSVTALQTGDAVNADFSGDGVIDHTALITKNTGDLSSNKYLSQHTTDREELIVSTNSPYTLKYWYDNGYTVYGYEIDKAIN